MKDCKLQLKLYYYEYIKIYIDSYHYKWYKNNGVIFMERGENKKQKNQKNQKNVN